VKGGDMEKLLKGADIKDVIPGTKSNIPFTSRRGLPKLGFEHDIIKTADEGTKINRREIDIMKRKYINDEQPKIDALKDMIKDKKADID
jgi:hypothetical protein